MSMETSSLPAVSRVDRKKSASLASFYRGRSKPGKRAQYDYDEQGNLLFKTKEGEIKETLALPAYRPTTEEEHRQMEEARMAAIQQATEAYQTARLALHHAADESPDVILSLNAALMEADIRLQRARFPLQCVIMEKGIAIRDLDFTQPREERKMPYPVAIQHHRPYPLQDYYVRTTAVPNEPMVSILQAKKGITKMPVREETRAPLMESSAPLMEPAAPSLMESSAPLMEPAAPSLMESSAPSMEPAPLIESAPAVEPLLEPLPRIEEPAALREAPTRRRPRMASS